ncbi:MAG: hypothetical protein Tsb0032_05600 [Kiloniellaceae bacterium]
MLKIMKPPKLALCALACGALAAGGPALGQSPAADDTTKLAEEIIDCAGLEAAEARLDCYDRLAAPLLGLEETPEAESAGAALHRFTGKEDWDSEVLDLTGPWRLVWQNQGSLLTVELHTAEGELVDVVGNQIGAGGGRSAVLDPGSYRLAVRGLGAWRLQVIEDTTAKEN